MIVLRMDHRDSEPVSVGPASIREAPSIKVLDDGIHAVASELVRRLTHPQLDLNGRLAERFGIARSSRHSAIIHASASTTRGQARKAAMDEGVRDVVDTAMGMLRCWIVETRHRTATGGAERSRLPLLVPAVVTKSCLGAAHCHESGRFRPFVSRQKTCTKSKEPGCAIPDLHRLIV